MEVAVLRAAQRVAEAAARRAGDEVLRALGGSEAAAAAHKSSAVDLVTAVDTRVEALLRDALCSAFPHFGFVGEESAPALAQLRAAGGAPCWVVDPVDGTTNFVHGERRVGVSIGLVLDDVAQVGVMLDVCAGDLFSAVRGGGATLNGAPLRVSATGALSHALVGTNIGVQRAGARFERQLAAVRRLSEHAVHGIRMAGSAACALCYVGAARSDVFFEEGLKPWDVAAGAAIVSEAGGVLAHPDGSEFRVSRGSVVACSNAALLAEFFACVGRAPASELADADV